MATTTTPTRPRSERARTRRPLDRRTGRRLNKTIAYILLSAGGLVMILPFGWLLSSSLKGAEDIFVLPPQWIPDPVRWENYTEVLSALPFMQYLTNTLIITVGATLGQVFSSALCAFAFARLRWPGRDLIFGIILATLMVPYTVVLIPTFILFKNLGWLDTFLPLIVPYWFAGSSAFFIFLLRQFFRTIPTELDDAARIDGASSWTIFIRIILPLSKPALAVVTVFSFLAHWNDFFGPLVYLTSDEKWTLALGLSALQGLQWGRDMTHLVMAVSVIMISPIVVLFLVAQRTFIRGIVLTGIKA